jgi:NADP-dependent 3-hydroxy acid dehydrogenase YdfG
LEKVVTSAWVVVTGAGSGIGQAVAIGLFGAGYPVVLVGRTRAKLQATADLISERFGVEATDRVIVVEIDFSHEDSVALLQASLPPEVGVAVLSAGDYQRGLPSDTSAAVFSDQVLGNAMTMFRAIAAVRPYLRAAEHGDLVVVSSTQANRTDKVVAAYSAGQHAIRALVNAVRDEEVDFGVRVTAIFAGRTATPRQERIFSAEGRKWDADSLIDPASIAETVLCAVRLDRRAEISELTVLPMWKAT